MFFFQILESLLIVTPQKVTFSNSHTLFGPHENVTIWVLWGFQKKNKPEYFSRRANHLLFLINCFFQDWIWGFSGNFGFSNSGINSRVRSRFKNYESSFLNQKNSNTGIDTNDEKSFKYPNCHKYPNSHTFLVLRKSDYLETINI